VINLVEFYLLACMPIRKTNIRIVLLVHSSMSLLGKSDERENKEVCCFDNARQVVIQSLVSRGLCC